MAPTATRSTTERETLRLTFRGIRFRLRSCRRAGRAWIECQVWEGDDWRERAGLALAENMTTFGRGLDWALRYAYEHGHPDTEDSD